MVDSIQRIRAERKRVYRNLCYFNGSESIYAFRSSRDVPEMGVDNRESAKEYRYMTYAELLVLAVVVGFILSLIIAL